MKNAVIIFLILNFLFRSIFAHTADDQHVDCPGIQGLKLAIDFKADGTKYLSKTRTDLYTSLRDDVYFTHLILEDSLFTNGNVEVQFEILNNNQIPIKKYILNKWNRDKSFPGRRITKINVHKFAVDKLGSPFDFWFNLPSDKKSKVDESLVPHDGRFIIGLKNSKPFCTFDFLYATGIEDGGH